jgi:hypothetical protein
MYTYNHLTVEQYNDFMYVINRYGVNYITEITDTPRNHNWSIIELTVYSESFICFSEFANAFWIDRHDTFITFSFWIDFSYYD